MNVVLTGAIRRRHAIHLQNAGDREDHQDPGSRSGNQEHRRNTDPQEGLGNNQDAVILAASHKHVSSRIERRFAVEVIP